MGMFDTVSFQGDEYQTKDLDCLLDHYRVNRFGRLQVELQELVPVPEEEWPGHPGDPFWGVIGTKKRAHLAWKDTNYHGDLNLYRFSGTHMTDKILRFTDGTFIAEVSSVTYEPSGIEGQPTEAA